MTTITYNPDGETLERFLVSTARVAIIQGPWGSGKSTASCYKLMMNALNQVPGPDGVRRRRTYVVRNTFDELKRTTIKTWLQQFPEATFGRFSWSRPFEHKIRLGDLDWEITFLALEDEDDRRKLLSAEISDIWFNEMREIDRQLVDDADGRIGRFPSKLQGGCIMPQMVGDTNPPSEIHWISIMSGQVPMPDNISADDRASLTKPTTWDFFMQPPGMIEQVDDDGNVVGYASNPKAENRKWLPDGYYENMVQGKTRSWIRVNILNKPGQLVAGKSVWPLFRSETHVAKQNILPVDGHTVWVGVDFGRTPAAVMGQRIFDRWMVQRELVAEGMGAKTFAEILRRVLGEWFPGLPVAIYGDPAGEALSQADDNSPFLMFRAAGLKILPAPSNDPSIRIAAVEELLKLMVDGGGGLVPKFLVSPSCIKLRAAMEGGYRYRKLHVSGDRYSETPDKNQFSHVADALQYMVIGAGEGRALLNRPTGPGAAGNMRRPAAQRQAGGSFWDRRRAR